MPELDLDGATLYYETAGHISSPALLLIHAGIANLRMWDPQMGPLAEHHFVVRFDTRGYGGTASTDDEFSNRQDAIDLLDHLGIARATAIGCSRGGGIAIDLALEHPGRIAGLVTIGSGPSGFPEVELTERENELLTAMDDAWEIGDWALLSDLEVRLWSIGPTRDEGELDPGFVETAYALNRGNLARSDEHPISLPLEPPAYGRLGELTIPTLVTVGERDVSAALTEYDYLLEAIPGATGHRFADSAHIPSVERPREFEGVLIDWLGKNRL